MQNYIDILTLNQDFQEFIFDKKLSRITENCSLLTDFSKIYKEELSKIPFRTNLLDSFNVNENAHSRLLISLLKYKPALHHFLNFLTKKKLNFDISLIDKPILTVEKWRIDGLVQEEGKYAFIIENKIHNREIFKGMDNKLQDFLAQKLQLTDNNVKNIDIITTKVSEIDELQKHLKALVEITREKCLFEWKDHLQKEFKRHNFIVNAEGNYPNVYVILEYEGKSFAAAIEYCRLNNDIYFGLGRHFSSQTLNEEVKYFFCDFLKDREFESNDWWYGWKDTTFQEAYTDFSFFLKEVLDKLETQNN